MPPNIHVEMVSKSGCPYCDDARSYLNRHNVPFTEIKMEDPAARQALYDALELEDPKRTVPQLHLLDLELGDRHHIGGYAELVMAGFGPN